MTPPERYIRDPTSGGVRLKTFNWDCPKCGHRTEVDLESAEPVDLVCRNCGWSVGQRVDLALLPDRPPSEIDEN
jgi:transcription elongation factor Elf1